MSKTGHRVITCMVALVMVLQACGGDSGVDGDTSSQTIGTTQAGSQVTSAVLPTALPNVPGISEECQGIANLMLGIAQIFTGNMSAIEQLFAAASQDLPSALASEIDLIKGAALQYQAALEEAGLDLSNPTALASLTPEQIEQLDAAFEPLQSPAVSDAFDAVGEYGEVECADFVPGG